MLPDEPRDESTATRRVRDYAIRPTGTLPRHIQTWVVLGIAVLMTGIIALSGSTRPADRKPISASLPPAIEPNDARIQEYRTRIDEEARRLTAAQAELDLAKRALTASPPAVADGAPRVPATGTPPDSGLENEKRQRAYRALFADNIALSLRKADRPAAAGAAPGQGATPPAPSPAAPPAATTENTTGYRVAEGTILEAVLTNRLDGSFSGPVNAMVTTTVYSVDRQHALIPQGSRLLGEAKAVASLGQQRLAIAFHRLLLPDGRSVTLDQFQGLSQVGETGLRDQVNNHYVQLFGASLAIGALGGLVQANTRAGFDTTGGDLYRQGVAGSLAQSSLHILDRFLNVLPTVTIREGQRLKVYVSGDLNVPAYGERS
jgi:type IV secretory pathway VirB10-like protein